MRSFLAKQLLQGALSSAKSGRPCTTAGSGGPFRQVFSSFRCAAPFAQMATGGHNADEVAASTSSSRQLERFTTGEDLQLALSSLPQDPGSTGPAQEEKHQRHSAHQIQRMKTMFKKCCYPDYMQRLKLSEELGLTPQQVLFWFQNRRTQLRARQNSRNENAMLLEENERLRWENSRMKAGMSRISCPNCSFSTWLQEASPEQRQLYFENARLREQISYVFVVLVLEAVQEDLAALSLVVLHRIPVAAGAAVLIWSVRPFFSRASPLLLLLSPIVLHAATPLHRPAHHAGQHGLFPISLLCGATLGAKT